MGKKAKKAAREIQRLRALYSIDAGDQPAKSKEKMEQDSPETVAPVISDDISSTSQSTKPVEPTQHSIVRRDLIFIAFLIVIMVAVLFALNYFITTTSFGTWLYNLIGGVV